MNPNKMHTNMDPLEVKRAEATANSIFRPDRRPGGLVPLYTDRLPTRALGVPFWEVDLTETQWPNFIAAIRTCGCEDTEAFATVLFGVEGYWRVSLDAATRPYEELIRHGWPSVWESAIFSTEGHWALAVSPDEFAIAAGDRRFIEALGEAMPEFTEAAAMNYVRECGTAAALSSEAPARTMIPAILEHVYGSDAARWMAAFTGNDR